MTDAVLTLRCSPETHKQGLFRPCSLGALRGERDVQEGPEMSIVIAICTPGAEMVFPCANWIHFYIYHFFFPAPKAFLHPTSLIKGGGRDKQQAAEMTVSHHIHTLDYQHIHPTKTYSTTQKWGVSPVPTLLPPGMGFACPPVPPSASHRLPGRSDLRLFPTICPKRDAMEDFVMATAAVSPPKAAPLPWAGGGPCVEPPTCAELSDLSLPVPPAAVPVWFLFPPFKKKMYIYKIQLCLKDK